MNQTLAGKAASDAKTSDWSGGGLSGKLYVKDMGEDYLNEHVKPGTG